LRWPEAARYLQYQADGEQRGWQSIEAEDAREVAGKPVFGRRGWTGEASFSGGRYYELRSGDAVELPFRVSADDDYLLYVAHMRRAAPSAGAWIEATPAAMVQVDGQLDEWAGAAPFAADRPEQILRCRPRSTALDDYRCVPVVAGDCYAAIYRPSGRPPDPALRRAYR